MKTVSSKGLLKDLRELIETARQDVARHVNSALVSLYWRMGKRIRVSYSKKNSMRPFSTPAPGWRKRNSGMERNCCYNKAQ